MLDGAIGQRWRTDLSMLSELLPHADYPTFIREIQLAKQHNKRQLAMYVAQHLNTVINPKALFDVGSNAFTNISASCSTCCTSLRCITVSCRSRTRAGATGENLRR